MMKNHLRTIALLAAAALPVAACGEDFLTETPSAFVSPENFYKTAGDAIAAVNAAYATFITPGNGLGSSDYYGRNYWMLVEYPTEVVTGRLSATNERSLMDNYNAAFNSEHAYLPTVWRAAYSGINRANSVIAHVPGVDMNTTRRDQIIGEAKFLRALHYYGLAGLFGGVPLKLEETQGFDAEQRPRASAAETWAQIQKDLTEAAAVLPVSWGAERGRATKGAALALLGKAYLQSAGQAGVTANFQKAIDALQQVRTLGYTLDPNYASLFNGTGEGSTEIIFALQNIRVDGLGGRLTEWFSPVTSPVIWQGGAGNHFLAERPFYDSYNAADIRKDGTWLTSLTNAGKTVTWAWNATGCANTAAATCIVAPVNYGSLGPVPRKYLDLASADGGMEEPDIVIVRYADVLLSLAEAINEVSGPTAEAYGYVNQVRARAKVPNLTAGLSKAVFKDSLFQERRYELAVEGHGIFDSRRNWTWAKSRVVAHIALRTNTTLGNSFAPFNSSVPKAALPGGVVADKWLLYPIPAEACRVNSALTQNPGWEDAICKNP
jgi:starch-binding outer membrane protein, SusD/RagB family